MKVQQALLLGKEKEMTGQWRPTDWVKTLRENSKQHEPVYNETGVDVTEIFEAGADAMLEAIRQLGFVIIDGDRAKYEAKSDSRTHRRPRSQ